MLLEGNFVAFEDLPERLKKMYDFENIALLFRETAESSDSQMLEEKEQIDKLMKHFDNRFEDMSPEKVLEAIKGMPKLQQIIDKRAEYKNMYFLLDESGEFPTTTGFVPKKSVKVF